MGIISIRGELVSANPSCEETFMRSYDEAGNLVEERTVSSEGDYASGCWIRKSADNGCIWGAWSTVFDDKTERHGKIPGSEEGDELLGWDFVPTLYDPKSGCKVGVGSTFYYIKGHDVGYFAMWEKGEDNVRTHGYFVFRRPDGTEVRRMLTFEDGGADYDPENLRNPAFLTKNRAMASDLRILPDGDLCFFAYPTMTLCCRIAGFDVNTYFPSCPDLMHGLLVARAHWNEDTQDYEITFSNPIMLGDLQSARGLMEPQLAILPNGRWLIVYRGAATMSKAWNTRTNPATPSFKWYTFSDDGGRTFAPSMPWHFDTREVVYSPASISGFFRSSKNGKLYWIGNILNEPWMIDSSGSNPRWPLQICQVNEEHGYLIKDTLTVIDTKRDGETYFLELSNFNILENRETLDLELRLTKICQHMETYKEYDWYSEAWVYYISFA